MPEGLFPNNKGKLPDNPYEFPHLDRPVAFGAEFETNGSNTLDVLAAKLALLGFGTHHRRFCRNDNTAYTTFIGTPRRRGCMRTNDRCSPDVHTKTALSYLLSNPNGTLPTRYHALYNGVTTVMGPVPEIHPDTYPQNELDNLNEHIRRHEIDDCDLDAPELKKFFDFVPLRERVDGEYQWRVKNDPTCGAEIESPILKGDKESMQLVHNMAEALDVCGEEADTRCGYHVHIEHEALKRHERHSTQRIVTFARHYSIFEPLLAMAIGTHRYDGGYNPLFNNISRIKANLLRNQTDDHNYIGGHRGWLNPTTPHNTMEFRGFEGTTDPADATNWIKLLLRIVQAHNHSPIWGLKLKQIPTLRPDVKSVRNFIRYLDLQRGGECGELRDWYLERARALWKTQPMRHVLLSTERTVTYDELFGSQKDMFFVGDTNAILDQIENQTDEEVGKLLMTYVSALSTTPVEQNDTVEIRRARTITQFRTRYNRDIQHINILYENQNEHHRTRVRAIGESIRSAIVQALELNVEACGRTLKETVEYAADEDLSNEMRDLLTRAFRRLRTASSYVHTSFMENSVNVWINGETQCVEC